MKGTEIGFSRLKFEDGKINGDGILENIPSGFNIIFAECNGLLLMASSTNPFFRRRYALCNPTTRQKTLVAFPDAFNEGNVVSHGVCYDHATNDFKIVMIAERNYAVYSCNDESWTRKKLFRTAYYSVTCAPGIFVDGATYWVLREQNRTHVVYFDSRTDELKFLPKPEELNSSDYDGYNLYISLACLRGGLCLYCMYNDSSRVRMWMKEKGIFVNCWNEFATIENFPKEIWWSEAIGSVENKIVIQIPGNKFVYYSPSENTIEEVVEDTDIPFGRLIPYRNSMYFPRIPFRGI
ncbi:PREDICTED: uncharacterized protein LOC105963290 [Erythranthe guttata]|uniref:uncharacterized protein LOC105963290 n=1 Tax=Erythranthe guttata TaxID=4155 RepID=UPI00064DF8FA|nr:PREDICTED: uncharacterized protein LOC105963290 [Erythranthe guttata]|eukprot:XP_012843136.1 PREDICTED: uncharacterized protein LOC105963290 [Erythranthe guttata]